MLKISRIVFFVFLFCFLPLASSAQDPQKLESYNIPKKLSFVMGDNGCDYCVDVARELYGTVLQRLGTTLDLQLLPTQRAIDSSCNGEFDGNVALTTLELYENNCSSELIKIDVPVARAPVGVYSVNSEKIISGWGGFAAEGLIVGSVRGTYVHQMLSKFIEKEQIVAVDNVEQGVALLENDRIDLFVELVNILEASLPQEKYSLLKQNGTLGDVTMYPYLYKTYSHLKSRFEKEMLDFMKSGEYSKIIEKYQGAATTTFYPL